MTATKRSRSRLPVAGHFVGASLRERALDARRCTVQLANGRLYLDAAATPETSLLGHDRPTPTARGHESLHRRLAGLDDRYAVVAVRRELGAAERLARRLAAQIAHGRVHAKVVDAHGSEPQTAGEILIAVENQSLAGRGVWLASALWRRPPEIVILGPSLAQGRPFAAILLERSKLAQVEGATLPPDPSSPPDLETASLVVAVIDAVAEASLLEHARRLGAYLAERLEVVCRLNCEVLSFVAEGLSARITLNSSLGAGELQRRLCERGVLTSAPQSDCLVIEPPLAMRMAEVDVIIGALRAALADEPTLGVLACCPDCQASAGAFSCAPA